MEFFHTHVSDESKKLVQEVLDSGFLNQGKMVAQLEKELTNFGLRNPVTVNSCTAALHMALEMCNVRGREVILPSQTFIATGLAVLMAGAKPVFCDVNTFTGNIKVDDLKRKINENTAAVIVVHWGGRPCDLDGVKKITDYRVPLIEDAAHCFGGAYSYLSIGQISDFTCFSFQAIKMVTAGDGGCLCVKNKDQYDQAIKMRWFGIDKRNMKRWFDGARLTEVTDLGYKYHMNDISAAIALGNLSTVRRRLKARQDIADIYSSSIKNEWIYRGKELVDASCTWWLYPLLIINGDKLGFCRHMEAAGIPVSAVDRGIHKNPVFGWSGELPGQNRFDDTQVSLPIHEALTMDDVRRVVDACNSWKG